MVIFTASFNTLSHGVNTYRFYNTLYKSVPSKADVMKDIISQWNEQAVKQLGKANKSRSGYGQNNLGIGWVSIAAIGNFYQNKRKYVVMLYLFRKNQMPACAVFAFRIKYLRSLWKVGMSTDNNTVYLRDVCRTVTNTSY